MEPIHIFYSQPEIDGNNVFTANISQENEVENVIFKKNKECAITGMTIKPDIGSYSLIKVSDKQKLKKISQKIQDFVKKQRIKNWSKNT